MASASTGHATATQATRGLTVQLEHVQMIVQITVSAWTTFSVPVPRAGRVMIVPYKCARPTVQTMVGVLMAPASATKDSVASIAPMVHVPKTVIITGDALTTCVNAFLDSKGTTVRYSLAPPIALAMGIATMVLAIACLGFLAKSAPTSIAQVTVACEANA